MLKRGIPFPLKVAASAVLLAVTVVRVDLSSLFAVTSKGSLGYILGGFAVAFAAWYINSYKWSLLLRASGVNVPSLELMALNLLGMFYNLLLPGQVGGEVAKAVTLARRGAGSTVAAMSVIADRATGLLALALLATVGAALSQSVISGEPYMAVWFVAFTLIVASATGLLLTRQGAVVTWRVWNALPLPDHPLLEKLGAMLGPFRSKAMGISNLWLPLTVALAFQAITASTNLLFCIAFGVHVDYLRLLWIFAAVSILQALPISIAGIGVREASYSYLLQQQGAEPASALAVALAVFASQVLMAFVGGSLQLIRAAGRGK